MMLNNIEDGLRVILPAYKQLTRRVLDRQVLPLCGPLCLAAPSLSCWL